jgi:hypothetical protein
MFPDIDAPQHYLDNPSTSEELITIVRNLSDVWEGIRESVNGVERKIKRWMMPPNGWLFYYTEDLKKALRKRSEGTCEWIIHDPIFECLGERSDWNVPCVSGAPGTILFASLISHIRGLLNPERHGRSPVIYFFCNNKSTANNQHVEDKFKFASILQSLLFQLWELFSDDPKIFPIWDIY